MSFQKDLKFGQDAELAFVNRFSGSLQLMDGRKGDIRLIKTNQRIELKTDRRTEHDTGNMFLERYSHAGNKTPGGPYQALEHGCELFAYLFAPTGTFYLFQSSALIDYLNGTHEHKHVNVFKAGSNASGFVVPIKAVEHLQLDWQVLFEPSKLLMESNADYHADKTRVSSSQLKTILRSPEQYYKEYVLSQRDNTPKDKFVFGSFVHTLILEPHKVQTEYAVYEGLRRGGKAWEQFAEVNKGKNILTSVQVNQAEKLFASYKANKTAVSMLEGALSEHNLFGEVLGVAGKARADSIHINKNYIVDVKTTSSGSDRELFALACESYRYDLSASYYLELARQTYKKEFDFYFFVLSKTDGQLKIYKAGPEFLYTGKLMYTRAIKLLIKCQELNQWPAYPEALLGNEPTVIDEDIEVL